MMEKANFFPYIDMAPALCHSTVVGAIPNANRAPTAVTQPVEKAGDLLTAEIYDKVKHEEADRYDDGKPKH